MLLNELVRYNGGEATSLRTAAQHFLAGRGRVWQVGDRPTLIKLQGEDLGKHFCVIVTCLDLEKHRNLMRLIYPRGSPNISTNFGTSLPYMPYFSAHLVLNKAGLSHIHDHFSILRPLGEECGEGLHPVLTR